MDVENVLTTNGIDGAYRGKYLNYQNLGAKK